MSEMRGTSSASPVRSARRSAFETTDSMTVIGRRCETPERLSTRLSSRASKAICSTNSRRKSGTRRVPAMPSQHVQGQAHGVAFDLHVALLHDVEEADLNLAREVWQLVDGEDAAVGARQQAVVDGQLVAQQVP